MTKILNCIIIGLIIGISTIMTSAQVIYPGRISPGVASVFQSADRVVVENKIFSLSVGWEGNKITEFQVSNKASGDFFDFTAQELLQLEFNKGNVITLAELALVKTPEISTVSGHSIRFLFSDKSLNVSVEWDVVLNDHENFIRQFLQVTSTDEVKEIFTLPIASSFNPRVEGEVDGSPMIASELFWAIENPLFQVKDRNGKKGLAVRPFSLKNTLDSPNRYEEVLTIGYFPKNQLRRAFLFYLDKIRVQPYRQLTFYDSWYDLSYDLDYLKEEDCIDRVRTWGDSLAKRGVQLNTFLWDSGWDDWNDMWNFNPHLPDGFKNINKEVEKYGATSGAWLSPWGGYNPFLEIRLQNVRDKYKIFKLENNNEKNGLSLADPHYYHYFKSVMLDLITNHGVTKFKIDGMGAGAYADGAEEYHEEMYALMRLVKEIRNFASNIYINLTVGTWPSPFWLCYADNIWKGGADYGYDGQGNTRQRWMNYRDYGIYEITQGRASLCPVSSLMLHGVTIADKGPISGYEMDDEVINQDIWSFFGSGTSLQELYINPHKLNSNTWDVLAEAIKWAGKNKDVLIDAHWIGGNPIEGEVYGYGAWQPDRGTLVLRNPSSQKVVFSFTLNEALQIPEGHNQEKYTLFNEVRKETLGSISVNDIKKIKLEPFEVKVISLASNP